MHLRKPPLQCKVELRMSQVMKVSADVCPLCQGTGWKPVSSGSEQRVARCDCRLRVRHQTLLSAARIPKRYEHCELSNFEFDGAHSGLASARLSACRFVEEYPLDTTGLLLVGDIGVGKTHLAVGIIKELILGKGFACLFCDYRELLKQIQNSYNASVQTTELEVLRPIFDAEIWARRTAQPEPTEGGEHAADSQYPLQPQPHYYHYRQHPDEPAIDANAVRIWARPAEPATKKTPGPHPEGRSCAPPA